MDINAPGVEGFWAWVEKYRPGAWEVAKSRLPRLKLSGLGFTVTDSGGGATTLFEDSSAGVPSTTSSSGILDTVKNALTIASQAYLTKTQLDAQGKILDMQIQRAKAGLPPLNIDPSQYGVPSVNIGVSANVKQLAIWAGLGIGGLFLLSMLRGRRT
jgi:hypothetical protein